MLTWKAQRREGEGEAVKQQAKDATWCDAIAASED